MSLFQEYITLLVTLNVVSYVELNSRGLFQMFSLFLVQSFACSTLPPGRQFALQFSFDLLCVLLLEFLQSFLVFSEFVDLGIDSLSENHLLAGGRSHLVIVQNRLQLALTQGAQ